MYRSQVTKADEKLTNAENLRTLTQDPNAKIPGLNTKQVARDGINQLHARTDYQQDLIDDIGKDLVDSHSNLKNVVTEIKSQGDTIVRVQNNVADTGTSIKRADKNITKMNTRAICHKVLLHILAVLLCVACIIVLFIKLL